MAKVTGSLQKSTEIMRLSNSLVKLPQLSATMRDMSMEMTKVRHEHPIHVLTLTAFMQAGIMEEMLDDIVDVEEDEDLEDEANEEVDRVLFDLTDGKLGQAGSVGELPVGVMLQYLCIMTNLWLQTLETPVQEADVDKEMEGYRKRLDGLLS